MITSPRLRHSQCPLARANPWTDVSALARTNLSIHPPSLLRRVDFSRLTPCSPARGHPLRPCEKCRSRRRSPSSRYIGHSANSCRLRVDARGRLAQLVRARALQARGRRFEPCTAHHSSLYGSIPDPDYSRSILIKRRRISGSGGAIGRGAGAHNTSSAQLPIITSN